MESPSNPLAATRANANDQHTEILILPDGKVLVHNLTPVMAAMLEQLNPNAKEIRERVRISRDHRGHA